MSNRPLNFRGNTASSIICQGNTVVHVIETGPHCNNANRTVFYKWNTAPSLSVGSGTTSRTVTVTTNQREQCYITISWSGVTSGSSSGYAGSDGNSGTFSATPTYSGTQGTLNISVTIKLVADNGITYSLSTSTTLGNASSQLIIPSVYSEDLCTVTIKNTNSVSVIAHFVVACSDSSDEVSFPPSTTLVDRGTYSITMSSNGTLTITCNYNSTSDIIGFTVYFTASGYTNSSTLSYDFTLS